ncbi:MAG TPA: hypothetical protein VII46_08690 [Acidimicrobiales bacterium]
MSHPLLAAIADWPSIPATPGSAAPPAHGDRAAVAGRRASPMLSGGPGTTEADAARLVEGRR